MTGNEGCLWIVGSGTFEGGLQFIMTKFARDIHINMPFGGIQQAVIGRIGFFVHPLVFGYVDADRHI